MIKPKFMAVLAGAIAFSFIATPRLGAQTGSSGPTNTIPPAPVNPLSNLNLSPPQEAQIKQIEALIQAQIQGVLTPEQRTKLQTLQTSGTGKGSALAQLNLSSKQISQLKEIEALAQQRLFSILNAEQQKRLQTGQLSTPSAPPTATSPIPSTTPAVAPPATTNPATTSPTSPSSPPSSAVAPAAPTNPAPATPTAESPALPPALAALNLTTDQQAQVQQVQALAQAQVQTILDPQQWQQLQSLQSSGADKKAALGQLNLSGKQKSQLQEVEILVQQRVLSILTDEQKKTLQKRS